MKCRLKRQDVSILGALTMRIEDKPRDREIISPRRDRFATISPTNLGFSSHQGARLLSFAFEYGVVKRVTQARVMAAELVEHDQRMIAGASVMAVPHAHLLLAVRRAYA